MTLRQISFRRVLTQGLIFLIIILLSGCDSERNRLIMGLFQTETPIPPTPTATQVSTPTPTQESLPTPSAIISFGISDHDYLSGDYESAERRYSAILRDNAAPEIEAAKAKLGLARIENARGQDEACQNRLIDALNETNGSEIRALMWYEMAECLADLNLPQEEINALTEYLKLRPESALSVEIQTRIGDLYFEIQDYATAMRIYSGLAEMTDFVSGFELWMKVADTFFIQGDYSNALLVWVKIYDANGNGDLRSRINQHMAQTYELIGSKEQAFARFQDTVNNYPRAHFALSALQTLNDHDQEVNDYQAGLIYYYQGNYRAASAAFYRYLESGAGYDGALYYYLGVSQMYVGNYQEAVDTFDKLMDQFPDDSFYASAWEEKAYVYWNYQRNYQTGADILLDYVRNHPDQAPAPEMLFQAGRVLEIARRLTPAAEAWERLIDEYPSYEKSAEALFLAGIMRYRAGSYDAATSTFNRLLLVATSTAETARANFWIGKTYEKKGDTAMAERYFREAAANSPTDYYTERALDKLNGVVPLEFSPSAPNFNSSDLANQKRIADQWMRITFAIDDSFDFDHPTLLQDNPDFRRAEELYQLGRYQDALTAYDAVRDQFETNTIASYQLLHTLVQKEIYRPAVFIARSILTSAGLLEDARTLTAPNYFNRIRFGAWYSEDVTAAWKEYNIHPFILYGMMRQESMYDPWIASGAGAQGLMQFMPMTGAEMAERLSWPDSYTQSDLLRANVSIRFAGRYLSTQLSYFKGNLFHMLAAYNAGAGNTANWVELDNGDPDLFLEVIRFEETRRYLRQVYENAKMYERLYQ